MKLEKITIKNYRSIADFSFEVETIGDGSRTYGLVGVNEAGKSSILKAIALKDGLKNEAGQLLPLPKDFSDRSKDVEIECYYSTSDDEISQIIGALNPSTEEIKPSPGWFSMVQMKVSYNYTSHEAALYTLSLPGCTTESRGTLEIALLNAVKSLAHKTIFWTAEPRFLISTALDLESFAASPATVSVPLLNSFTLAGITEDKIRDAITLAKSDSTELEHLERILSGAVTKHIQATWPGHPIEISFKINNGQINFHVRDLDVHGKSKTADQRSDGFKQFISFLLTVSAQNRNEILSNTILLLDEPETHLHPKAQEDLLKELIAISRNQNNNICFIATHSVFMIDKADLSRNYKVSKKADKTECERFDSQSSTYASITYDVFGIASSDYHTQLYGLLHQRYQDADPSAADREKILDFDGGFFVNEKKLAKNRPWKGKQNGCALPTYIRNCNNHPDSGYAYTNSELVESITLLKGFVSN